MTERESVTTPDMLADKAEKCALYDFDSVEMVECKWADWQDIINTLRSKAASAAVDREAIKLALCKSRTCEGINCCQWPAQMSRKNCPVKNGGYDDAADAIASLIAASAAAWQPIETAPKDGKAFLACVGQWITTCCWNKHRHDWCSVSPAYTPYPADERPTHWMQLPAAPAASATNSAPARHDYSPSALHMGDCGICGNVRDAEVHAPHADTAKPTTPQPSPLRDTAILDWLEHQTVDTIYLDDGTIIDVRGNSVRDSIEKCKALAASEGVGSTDGGGK